MKEKVIYHMATMPFARRTEALKEVLPRILPQCDEIHIYLNNFKEIPEFLKHPKVKTYLSDDHMGDIGDVGKFYLCEKWGKGYHFTVDDKILYPKDYTEKMIATIEKYKRKVVVSAHGRIFHDRKSTSYYWDCKLFRGCTMGFPDDEFVHELGTGAMAFHRDTLPKFDLSIFDHINMTDIYFSIFLQKLKIPILNPERKNAWIWVSNKHDDNFSIHNTWNKKDGLMTDVINAFIWSINKVEI
jgi:hypothetical protein